MNVTIPAADKQKSLLITTIIFLVLILILFFIRFWPPANMEELVGGGGGVTINFGNVEAGSGDNFENEDLNIKNQNNKPIKTVDSQDDKILSQENTTEETDVVITKKVNVVKSKVQIVKKNTPQQTVIKPKIQKVTNDALDNFLKGGNKGGDGNTNAKGNQGSANGSLSNQDYGLGGSGGGNGSGNGQGSGSGNGNGSGSGTGGGSGSGSGYFLGDRKAISKPKPNSECSNDVGNVVVEITVNQNGNVIKAVAGVKGTTITASCLKEQARQAALNTKWQPKENAPAQQVGKIIYSFSLN